MKDRQIEKRAYSKEGFQIGFINSSNLNSANLQSFFLFLGQTFMASTKRQSLTSNSFGASYFSTYYLMIYKAIHIYYLNKSYDPLKKPCNYIYDHFNCHIMGWSKMLQMRLEQKFSFTKMQCYRISILLHEKENTNKFAVLVLWPSSLQIWAILQYWGYPTVLRVATKSKSYLRYVVSLIKNNYHESNVIKSNHITVIRKPVSPNGSHITLYSSFLTLHFLSNGNIWAAHSRWPSPQLLKHNPPPFCSLHTRQVLSLPLKY